MTYMVHAKRWEHGWELHIGDDIGVTQSHTLADAERMVRDYLRLDGHPDWDAARVVIAPELGSLTAEVDEARRETIAAMAAQKAAATQARTVAMKLRARGLSVTDTAAVLGVSRGRVSQLLKAS